MKQVPASGHWSKYWAGGNLTSLPQDFVVNYDGEIAEFWHAQFRRVPDHGKLLDVCTGNGAVVLLAAAWSRSEPRSLGLTGIDAARIDPGAIAAKYPSQAGLLSTVELISDCRLEDIDLPTGTFDLVTSQYGIEYCDWSQAAAQVSRLLKPGGRFAFLSHAVSTDIIKYMEDEWREYEILQELEFLSAIEAYLQHKSDFPEFQKTMKHAQAAVSSEYRKSNSPLLESILNMLANVVPMDQAVLEKSRARLGQFRQEISHGRQRLKDLLRVNRAIQSDAGWYRVFEQYGLVLDEEGDILYKGVHNSGRYYCFVKPAHS